jgi:hypothetical protein
VAVANKASTALGCRQIRLTTVQTRAVSNCRSTWEVPPGETQPGRSLRRCLGSVRTHTELCPPDSVSGSCEPTAEVAKMPSAHGEI